MNLDTLRDLYIHELQDVYSAEQQITQALPLMADAASSPELKTAFQTHLQETQGQIQRLEQVFQLLGQQPGGETCKGMQGLIAEGQSLIQENPDKDVLDAGLIAAAQKVEHYEIASYGTLRTYAMQLGEQEHCNLLQQTLDEEGKTDHLLTQLAEAHINQDAIQGDRQAA